jgi:hypothetical protein
MDGLRCRKASWAWLSTTTVGTVTVRGATQRPPIAWKSKVLPGSAGCNCLWGAARTGPDQRQACHGLPARGDRKPAPRVLLPVRLGRATSGQGRCTTEPPGGCHIGPVCRVRRHLLRGGVAMQSSGSTGCHGVRPAWPGKRMSAAGAALGRPAKQASSLNSPRARGRSPVVEGPRPYLRLGLSGPGAAPSRRPPSQRVSPS